MDISFITEYISPISLLICLVVGYIIKNCTASDKIHQLIPCIVAVLGVIICAWGEMAFTPAILAAGLISGLASTGLYEALRNVIYIGHESIDPHNKPEKIEEDE